MRDEGDQSQSDLFVLMDMTTSRYALPVKDNIDYTRSIPDLRGAKSELSEHKLPTRLRRLTNAYYKSSGDSIALTSTARGMWSKRSRPRRRSGSAGPYHYGSSTG